MIQKDKELLIRDLCARLPYGVKISVNDRVEVLEGINVVDYAIEYSSFLASEIEDCRPYLFPLSSMTEEQKVIYGDLCYSVIQSLSNNMQSELNELINWLNANHFDYRGLIPMGLAIDATGLNIY